jgi:PqqD family protein of HPr-rel-A system
MERVWQAMPGQLLRWRVWDDEGVVYNDLSGDTHLLGAPSLHLLATVAAGRANDAALAAALAAEFDLDPGQDVGAERDALLAELVRLHLIERAA